jgi:hypothetical protein
MFPMTSATEIQRPMGRGAEDSDEGEAGGGADDEAGELEKEGSGRAVIGGDGSTPVQHGT